jgi:hypothetical protein
VALLGLSLICSGAAPTEGKSDEEQTLPARLKRKDSYFGVHFDFHALLTDKNIGENTTPAMINAIIDLIHPDYIECDTKGHPGVSSYPTKVGNSGGSFVGDPLRVWREVTAQRGVALYGHHSGIWDNLALQKHPEWAAVDSHGKRSDHATSVFSPYSDKLLIPQLTELAVDYGLDGAWVDGDCWVIWPDYCDAARAAFAQQTGIKTIPTKPGDPGWSDWTEFQREAFKKYVGHYLEKVKGKAPDFQMASNWAFTERMPEPVSCNVDFISGDIGGRNSVNIARYSSRLMASQGITWDLMSWNSLDWTFGTLDPPKTRKPAIQLMQEAACVIAQGGGYQAVFSQAGAGYPPLRDGSVDLVKLKPMGEVAKFCRARQKVCFKAKPIPQIAVLCSTAGTYRTISEMGRGSFEWEAARQHGIVSCLLDNQYAVDVLLSYKLSKRLNEYPMVVINQYDYIEPDLRDQVANYVKQGGHLLLVGEGPGKLFGGEIAGATGKEGVQVPAPYSLMVHHVGKGLVATIPMALAGTYDKKPAPVVRDVIGAALKKLFPDPLAVVTGSRTVDVSAMRTQDGKLAIHLVNTSGPHWAGGLITSIPPAGPLTVAIRSKTKPSSVVLEPGERTCNFDYENGIIRVNIDQVKIHDAIVVNNETPR